MLRTHTLTLRLGVAGKFEKLMTKFPSPNAMPAGRNKINFLFLWLWLSAENPAEEVDALFGCIFIMTLRNPTPKMNHITF